MKTVEITEADFLHMQATINHLQSEVNDLKQMYISVLRRIGDSNLSDFNVRENQISESERRLELIENGSMNTYSWEDISVKYGLTF